MSTAFAPDPSADADRTGQLLTSITDALLDLFDTNETFFITNHSMRVLIRGLAERLDTAVQAGKEAVLFEQWHENMPLTKQTLLRLAREYPLELAGGSRPPLMTEERSQRLLGMCPEAPEY